MKMRVLVLSLLTAVGVAVAAETTVKDEPIKPIEPAVVKDAAKVELGKKLFFDPRLSKSGGISCNSCHNLSMGGTDNLTSSIGDHWQRESQEALLRVAVVLDRRVVDRDERERSCHGDRQSGGL